MVARPHAQGRLMFVLAALTTAAVLLVPMAVTPEHIDRYRVLKESLARATGVLSGVLLVAAVAFGGTERLRTMLRRREIAAVAAAGSVWMLLATALSTHRANSLDSLVTFLTSLLIFIAVWYAAPRISLVLLDLLVLVVAVNVALATAQAYDRWQPFRVSPLDPKHMGTTGLIDNPNVLGSYLALVAVILTVAAIRVRGLRGGLYAFGALCATWGVLVSETRAALIALAAGFLLVGIGRSVKRTVLIGVPIVLLFALGAMLQVPAVMRVLELPRTVREQGLEVASSGRMAPVLAALEMARDRPLIGVGPGAFRFHYMPYKLRILDDYGRLLRGTFGTMFGEVHNDHVQILAETGVIGYALFLAAVVVLVRAVRSAPRDDPRGRVVSALALPLAGTLLVLGLAQFPLYVPVTRHLLVTMAGLLAGWSSADTADGGAA